MRKLLATLLLLGTGAAAAEVSVKDAWIGEGPPAAAVLAGFMHLQNDSAKDSVLTGVSSPDFAKVEMHKSVHEGGMARMLPQERIVVPANGEVSLQPGGYHLMLIQPRQALTAGASVSLTLQFEGGEAVELNVPVRKQHAAGMHHKH